MRGCCCGAVVLTFADEQRIYIILGSGDPETKLVEPAADEIAIVFDQETAARLLAEQPWAIEFRALPSDEQRAIADRLHSTLVAAIETAPQALLDEIDWGEPDEDWLRDGIGAAAHYARWRESGVHEYGFLNPVVPPWEAIAQQMADALYGLAGRSRDSIGGWHVPDDVRVDADRVLAGLHEAADPLARLRAPLGIPSTDAAQPSEASA